MEKYSAKAAAKKPVPEFDDEEQVWPVNAPRRVRVAQTHPTYAAMVETMDTAIGRVLGAIRDAGVDEHTIVIFMSDNGGLSTAEGSPTSNLPFRGGKGWLYEGGIRVPLIVRWPGATRPGSTSDTPVISTDLYPTILEMAGLPARPAQHLDGLSLLPLVRQSGSLARDTFFWHYPHYSNQGGFPGGAIREGNDKLIERFEDGRVHLYDLARDRASAAIWPSAGRIAFANFANGCTPGTAASAQRSCARCRTARRRGGRERRDATGTIGLSDRAISRCSPQPAAGILPRHARGMALPPRKYGVARRAYCARLFW